MDIRNPAVEGRFYPGTKQEAFALIEHIAKSDRYAEADLEFEEIIGAILPHAGHIYSGYQTIPFFRLLSKRNIRPETIIILNPNHSGYGEEISLDEHAYWKNDAGMLGIDQELSELLQYPKDARAQRNEHSCEVILPFIQYYYGNEIKILPVCLKSRMAEDAERLGEQLHEAVNQLQRNVLVIASSDFTHFMSPEQGYKFDQIVLDRIVSKEIYEVEKVVKEHDISVCGSGPIMTLMAYAAAVKNEYKTAILARGHSGEVSPSKEVVDYISMLFYY